MKRFFFAWHNYTAHITAAISSLYNFLLILLPEFPCHTEEDLLIKFHFFAIYVLLCLLALFAIYQHNGCLFCYFHHAFQKILQSRQTHLFFLLKWNNIYYKMRDFAYVNKDNIQSLTPLIINLKWYTITWK